MATIKRKYRYISGILLVVAVMWLFRSAWLPSIASFLIVNDLPPVSDMIIVPSGNSEDMRIDHAIELYSQKLAPKILLCGELALQKETGFNLGKIYAVSHGVPENDILIEEDSKSTYENALFTRDIVIQNHCKSVILVTIPTHTKRTKRIFREVFPDTIAVFACCDKDGFNTTNWWTNRNQSREVVYEYFASVWHTLME